MQKNQPPCHCKAADNHIIFDCCHCEERSDVAIPVKIFALKTYSLPLRVLPLALEGEFLFISPFCKRPIISSSKLEEVALAPSE